MQYYRCKCGKREAWNSGYPIHDCQGCEECKTTVAQSPSQHKELIPHDFSKIHYNQNTGRPYKMCSRCMMLDEESYKLSKYQEMKKLIEWLEGKKVIIGMGIILVNSLAQWKFPDALPADVYSNIRLTGELIGGIGIFDKARRTDTGKRIQEVITNATKKK